MGGNGNGGQIVGARVERVWMWALSERASGEKSVLGIARLGAVELLHLARVRYDDVISKKPRRHPSILPVMAMSLAHSLGTATGRDRAAHF